MCNPMITAGEQERNGDQESAARGFGIEPQHAR